MEMNKTIEECLQGCNDDFNDQHRPFRRRPIYWRTADSSAEIGINLSDLTMSS